MSDFLDYADIDYVEGVQLRASTPDETGRTQRVNAVTAIQRHAEAKETMARKKKRRKRYRPKILTASYL